MSYERSSPTHAFSNPNLSGLSFLDFCRILKGRIFIWALPAVLLTAICMHVSMIGGRMSIPPPYDDINYFDDGLSRLITLESHGLDAFWSQWNSNQPHSPGSTLQALVAFALFGPHVWAPYVTNVIFVLFSFLLFDFLTWGLGWWKKAILFLLLLSPPVMENIVTEFRPDLPSSLLLAGGIILILHGDFFWQPRWVQALGGFLLGLSLWMKPSAFAALIGTVVGLFGLVFILEMILRFRQTSRYRILLGLLFGFGTFALVGLPYVLANARLYADYMYKAFYGDEKPLAAFDGSFWDNIRVYWDGPEARYMIGDETISICFVLFIGCLVFLLFKGPKDWVLKFLAYFCVLFVLFAGPTYMPVKTRFFGANFEILTLLLAIAVLAGCMRRLPWIGSAVAAVMACYIFANSTGSLYGGVPPGFQYLGKITDELVQDSSKYLYRPRPSNVLVTAAGDFNSLTLELGFLQKGYTEVQTINIFAPSSIVGLPHSLSDADVVIAAEPGDPHAWPHHPSGLVLEEMLTMTRAREDFYPVGHRLTYNGKGYYLFGKKNRYFGFIWDDDFFVGVTLPDAQVPVYGAKRNCDSVLLAYAHPEDFHLNVDLKFKSKLVGQKIHVSFNGTEIGLCEPEPEQWCDFIFDVPPSLVLPGSSRNSMSFTYEKAEVDSTPNPVPQVYYEEIQVRPVSTGLRGAARGGLAACRPDWISRN